MKSFGIAAVTALGMFVSGCSALDQNGVTSPTAIEASDDGMAARGSGGGGKPGSGEGGGGSLTHTMVVDGNGDGFPSFGDTVTFVVETSATAYPYVTLKCYKDGTLVSQESNAMFATSLSQDFTLGPTMLWTSGAADCTATLESWGSSRRRTVTVLASTSFAVN